MPRSWCLHARVCDTRSADRGSTLLEALIATLILTTGLLAMADLIRVATASNLRARNGTVAAILAEQKMEQLRALTDLPLSPSSLQRNTAGFVDHLDGGGAIVGSDSQAPASALYTRRWSIESLPAYAGGGTVLIQVLVTSVGDRGRADQGAVTRLPGDARLVTIKTTRVP